MHNALPHRRLVELIQTMETETTGGAPVCLAVCNRTGGLAALLNMDGAPERAEPIARAKAYTAMRMETTTRAFHERLRREGLTLADFCDSGFTALAGGAPVLDAQGRCIGGVGISGRTPDEDAVLAERLADALRG